VNDGAIGDIELRAVALAGDNVPLQFALPKAATLMRANTTKGVQVILVLHEDDILPRYLYVVHLCVIQVDGRPYLLEGLRAACPCIAIHRLAEIKDKLAADKGLALETIERMPFDMWRPAECPLCMNGVALDFIPAK